MKLVVISFLSLDGVQQSPGGKNEDTSNNFDLGGWVQPYSSEDFGSLIVSGFAKSSAFLFGRKTFDIMAAHWPKFPDPADPIASRFNGLPKYVVSGTKTDAEREWKGSTVVDGKDLKKQIQELKALPGDELQVHGCGELARGLHDMGLVDEFRLFMFPIVLGKGKKLFAEGSVPRAFEVVETKTTEKGLMYLVLRPKGPVELEDVPDITELAERERQKKDAGGESGKRKREEKEDGKAISPKKSKA
ncbi:hypothetical protein HDV00_007865 [Rhizophlyctis rosea]|nr:hypothetical protein HDV00_007865 [Rhizophlyctis rosea]